MNEKKVYILMRMYPMEGFSIEGVYATYELAFARRKKMKGTRSLEIEEFEVEGTGDQDERDQTDVLL